MYRRWDDVEQFYTQYKSLALIYGTYSIGGINGEREK